MKLRKWLLLATDDKDVSESKCAVHKVIVAKTIQSEPQCSPVGYNYPSTHILFVQAQSFHLTDVVAANTKLIVPDFKIIRSTDPGCMSVHTGV